MDLELIVYLFPETPITDEDVLAAAEAKVKVLRTSLWTVSATSGLEFLTVARVFRTRVIGERVGAIAELRVAIGLTDDEVTKYKALMASKERVSRLRGPRRVRHRRPQLGSRMMQARQRAGLSTAEASEVMNCARWDLERLERDTCNESLIRLSGVSKLARHLRVHIDSLMEPESPMDAAVGDLFVPRLRLVEDDGARYLSQADPATTVAEFREVKREIGRRFDLHMADRARSVEHWRRSEEFTVDEISFKKMLIAARQSLARKDSQDAQ